MATKLKLGTVEAPHGTRHWRQAERRWCPFSNSSNRPRDLEDGNIETSCLVDGCMAWQWVQRDGYLDANGQPQFGWCGLAGKPPIAEAA